MSNTLDDLPILSEVSTDPSGTLAWLDTALQGVQVVMLGEQSHGDGAAFATKAALVRYLHLRHGFNVLAFEADFFSLFQTWQQMSAVNDVSERIAPQVYRHWRVAAEMQPLWELVRERLSSLNPLIVTGIDPRLSGPYARDHLVNDLERFLPKRLTPQTDKYAAFRALLLDLVQQEYRQR